MSASKCWSALRTPLERSLDVGSTNSPWDVCVAPPLQSARLRLEFDFLRSQHGTLAKGQASTPFSEYGGAEAVHVAARSQSATIEAEQVFMQGLIDPHQYVSAAQGLFCRIAEMGVSRSVRDPYGAAFQSEPERHNVEDPQCRPGEVHRHPRKGRANRSHAFLGNVAEGDLDGPQPVRGETQSDRPAWLRTAPS